MFGRYDGTVRIHLYEPFVPIANPAVTQLTVIFHPAKDNVYFVVANVPGDKILLEFHGDRLVSEISGGVSSIMNDFKQEFPDATPLFMNHKNAWCIPVDAHGTYLIHQSWAQRRRPKSTRADLHIGAVTFNIQSREFGYQQYCLPSEVELTAEMDWHGIWNGSFLAPRSNSLGLYRQVPLEGGVSHECAAYELKESHGLFVAFQDEDFFVSLGPSPNSYCVLAYRSEADLGPDRSKQG
jgi:hypothetical protein